MPTASNRHFSNVFSPPRGSERSGTAASVSLSKQPRSLCPTAAANIAFAAKAVFFHITFTMGAGLTGLPFQLPTHQDSHSASWRLICHIYETQTRSTIVAAPGTRHWDLGADLLVSSTSKQNASPGTMLKLPIFLKTRSEGSHGRVELRARTDIVEVGRGLTSVRTLQGRGRFRGCFLGDRAHWHGWHRSSWPSWHCRICSLGWADSVHCQLGGTKAAAAAEVVMVVIIIVMIMTHPACGRRLHMVPLSHRAGGGGHGGACTAVQGGGLEPSDRVGHRCSATKR